MTRCAACDGELLEDQRYCLECGTRRAEGLPDAREILTGPPVAIVAPAVGEAGAASRPRLSLMPGLEMSLQTAIVVFALVLGLGAYAGASTVPGSPAPVRIALAPSPPPVTALVAQAPSEPATPDAATATTATTETAAVTADAGSSAAATGTSTPDTTTTDTTDTTDTSNGTDTTPANDTAGTTPTTPPLKHVFVISLGRQGYGKLYDPSAGGPYLADELPKKGALLSRVFSVAHGSAASGIALVSGQGPNPDTVADCPSPTDLDPGTVGKDDQAAGTGCLFSTDVFTIADSLASKSLAWRAYVESVPGAPAPDPAAAACATPNPRNPFLYFKTISTDPACAQRIAGLDALQTDLATTNATPALAYIVPSACHDAGDAPCAEGAPAGPAGAEPFLRDIVPKIIASAAYKDAGALLIVAGEAPATGPDADSSAKGSDAGGGGRVGALLLSPLIRGGGVVDAPLDQYDLLKTISEGLGVNPTGYAASKKTKGIPTETWTAR